MFAELALQLLQLHHQPRQLLVGALGIGGQAQRTGDRLSEQRELRAELGHGLGRPEAAPLLLGARAGLVEACVERRDRLDHAGALRGVVDLQAGHQLRQHVQFGRHRLHRGQLFGQRACGPGLLRGRVELLQARVHRRQRLLAAEERAGGRAHPLLRLLQRLAHRVDRAGVDVAVVADGEQVPALARDRAQRLDEFVDRGPVLRLQLRQQRAVRRAGLGHGRVGLAADVLHLLVLVEHRLAGGADLVQQRGRAVAVGVVEPVMRVEHAPGAVHQQLVALRGDARVVDAAAQFEQVGDAAYQRGIADPAHEAVAGRPLRGELLAGERGLPDLHRVDARGRVALGVEQHHAPVLQEGVAMAEQRILQLAADGVVDEQRRAAAVALVEHVQHVLAVGRAHATLVLHALHGRVEGLVLAALQVVAPGKDDPVVLGQLHAGLHDGVVAHHRSGDGVVDQAAPLLLAIRQDLQQHQRADPGVVDGGIVQRLGTVLHRLVVHALAGAGVVLDLDREVAAGGFDEQRVEDVQVRMAAGHHQVAGGAGPFEVERRRQGDVAFAARVDPRQRAVAADRPAEHAHVAAALADLERGQQLAVALDQLQQARMAIVGVEFGEVVDEARLRQEAVLRVDRGHVVTVGPFDQPVQPEHVLDPGLGLESQEHVVAEQQQVVADLDDVATDAVVLGTHPEPARHLEPAVAELLQPARVEAVGQRAQARTLLDQPAAQHLVGAALGDGLVDGAGGGAAFNPAGVVLLRIGHRRSSSCWAGTPSRLREGWEGARAKRAGRDVAIVAPTPTLHP